MANYLKVNNSQIKLLLIFTLFFSATTYHTNTNACIFKLAKGLVFSTGIATISYFILKAIADSEKNTDTSKNTQNNGPASKILTKVDSNAEKIEKVAKETAQKCKESINKNFNIDCDEKLTKIKKQTKSFMQKAYDWIGNTLGLKNKA